MVELQAISFYVLVLAAEVLALSLLFWLVFKSKYRVFFFKLSFKKIVTLALGLVAISAIQNFANEFMQRQIRILAPIRPISFVRERKISDSENPRQQETAISNSNDQDPTQLDSAPTLYAAVQTILNSKNIDYQTAAMNFKQDFAAELKDEKNKMRMLRGFSDLIQCQKVLLENAHATFLAKKYQQNEAGKKCLQQSGYFFHREKLLSEAMLRANMELIQEIVSSKSEAQNQAQQAGQGLSPIPAQMKIQENYFKTQYEVLDQKSEFLKSVFK